MENNQNRDDVWFIADTHFQHEAILKHCQRPFSSVEEMNEVLVDNWNRLIGKKDRVYILGDFAFKDHQKFIQRLHGFKHMILGNHDEMNCDCLNHFTSVSTTKMLTIDKRIFCLNHVPFRTWEDCYRGSVHLFGHCHGRMKTYNLSFDIGVDTHNYKPYHISEVINMVKERLEIMEKAHRIIIDEKTGRKQFFQDDVQYLEYLLRKK